MDIRKLGVPSASALLIVVMWCAWLWKPERQMRLHQRDLIEALEGRDWDQVSGFLAGNYSDRWGHDKEFVLRESREVFRQFIVLQIDSESTVDAITAESGTMSVQLRMQGKGGPLAEYAMMRVNALRQPWHFEWVKGSAKPWDWVVVRVDHPELKLEGVNPL